MDDDPSFREFEAEFQWFMHGGYPRVREEDWERYYAQHGKEKPKTCIHGKTVLTCHVCYFNGTK